MRTSLKTACAVSFFLFLFGTSAWAPPPAGGPPGQGGTPPGQLPPATATVQVQCPGDSINAALQTPAVELTVEISGRCVEEVVVTRDRVTLRGSDPNVDGIQAAETDPNVDPLGAALFVRDTRFVTIENLLLTGGIDSGLHLLNAREGVTVTNAHINANAGAGVFMVDFFANISDSEMLQNALSAAWLIRNSGLACDNCTLEGNTTNNIAVALQHDSNASLNDSTLTGGRLSCNSASRAFLTNTSITSPVHAIGAVTHCEVVMDGGTLAGTVRASRSAQVLLFGVEQLSVEAPSGNPASNSFNIGASLYAEDTMLKDVGFFSFANGTLGESTANASSAGAVSCSTGSDFFCLMDPSQVGSSSCGGCSICGDGELTPNEQCDDGNTDNGDGCDASCQIE